MLLVHVLTSCVVVSLTRHIILTCQRHRAGHVPGVAGRRANGGFHARVSAGRKQFARHEWAQKAAYLLGCTLEELSSSIFKHQAKGTLPRASSIRQPSDENGTADAGTSQTTFTHTIFPLHSSHPPAPPPLCATLASVSTHTHTHASAHHLREIACCGRSKAYLRNEYHSFTIDR